MHQSASDIENDKNKKSRLIAKRRLVFDDFVFYPAEKRLSFKGVPRHLDAKMLQLLGLLIQSYPKTVTKDELMNRLWPDTNVSDWSLARLVSDTRKLIENDEDKQSLIKTVRGKGYVFAVKVDEIIEAYPEQREAKQLDSNSNFSIEKRSAVNFDKKNIMAVTVIFLAIIMAFHYFNIQTLTPKVLSNQHLNSEHISSMMHQMYRHLQLTKTTFRAQYKRRIELEKLLKAKSPVDEPLTAEMRMMKHYPNLTKEEKFIFEQIRALTEGPMYQGNNAILMLLDSHPELYQQIGVFTPLYNHLSIWKNKYHRLFEKRDDMSLVYVGVEDGVPFPSEIDGLVEEWIKIEKSNGHISN